jgi:hypothetical protein
VGKDLFLAEESGAYTRSNRDKQQNIVSLEVEHRPLHFGRGDQEPKTALPLPKEKAAIALQAQQLAGLVGKYVAGNYLFTITTEGSRIYLQRPLGGGEREELFAESESKFFLRNAAVFVEFTKDSTGQVNGLMSQKAGQV